MSDEIIQYVIYERPSDYPGGFVVREFRIDVHATIKVRSEAKYCASLEIARKLIPEGLFRVPRIPEDDPVIVEVWL